MTSIEDSVLEVLRECNEPGDALAPSELLLAVAREPDPIRALSDMDRANALFEAFAKEFAFVRTASVPPRPLNPEDRKKWIALIRWLVRELSQWRDRDDQQRFMLAAIFVVTQSCDRGDVFWSALPDGPADNAELGTAVEKLLSTSKVEFRSWRGGPVPIWEVEWADALKQADEQRDWVEIGNKWQAFAKTFLPDFLQTQMVRYLYRYGFDRLIHAVSNVSQTPVAMQVSASLSTEQRLRVANVSNNPYVQFSCVHQTLLAYPTPRQLLLKEQELLTDLLLKIATDGPRWEAWMRVFNSHPLRCPALQVPLGRALADAPIAAVKAYVDSINLCAIPVGPEESRRCVAECLREFKQTATAGRRTLLWRHAHDRWKAWQFDQANHSSYLFKINWSQLDYAVVAYAVECMDAEARKNMQEEIINEIKLIDTVWHESLMRYITRWNCLLSQFQPYARACHAIRTSEDWLTETQTYSPTGSTTDYLVMMAKIS